MALASLQQRSRLAAHAAFSERRAPRMAGARGLAADFAHVSGAKGVAALGYILATALLEAFSLSLLVPLLGLMFASTAQSAHAGRVAAVLFAFLPAETPFMRLVLLLSLFTVLTSLRAALAGLRDLSVMALQVRFTGALRLRLARHRD